MANILFSTVKHYDRQSDAWSCALPDTNEPVARRRVISSPRPAVIPYTGRVNLSMRPGCLP